MTATAGVAGVLDVSEAGPKAVTVPSGYTAEVGVTGRYRWYLRWILLLGSLLVAAMPNAGGDSALALWTGVAGILLAGAIGTSPVAVGLALGLTLVRYVSFVAPMIRFHFTNTWFTTIALWFGFSMWEALPLIAGGVVGVILIRRKGMPLWLVAGLPAAIFTAASVWVIRPYRFSFGAMTAPDLPGAVWLFGSDLLGGLILGWLCVSIRVVLEKRSRRTTILTTTLAPVVLLGLAGTGYLSYTSSALGAATNPHDVISIQAGLAPWSGGYAQMSDRALIPMVTFSGIRPDLLLFPENMVQVNPAVDPDDDKSLLQRHYTAVGMGIAVPYSQVAFGIRDHHQSRMYFTDIINGKPEVTWKDMAWRVPFVDTWPDWADGLVHRWGFSTVQKIAPAQRTAPMTLLARDPMATSKGGLKTLGKALVLMSGEVRDPRLIQSVRQDDTILVGYNPTISGWLGTAEARGASVQSDARMLELGLLGYRVGQLAGTGFFSPWSDTADDVKVVGNGSMRIKAMLPEHRISTGYTAFFWVVSLYLAPLAVLGMLGWLFWSTRKGSPRTAAA